MTNRPLHRSPNKIGHISNLKVLEGPENSITKCKVLIKQMCINVKNKHVSVVVYVNNLGLRVQREVL